MEEVAALKDITRRQEHLIAELNHALHGKRSEKLSEVERQFAFEDLSIALAEVETEKEAPSNKASGRTTRPAPRRTIGNLPATLPRIEEIIEPDNLICPDGVTQVVAPAHLITGGLPTEATLAHVVVSKAANRWSTDWPII
jgi:hypothetical protein